MVSPGGRRDPHDLQGQIDALKTELEEVRAESEQRFLELVEERRSCSHFRETEHEFRTRLEGLQAKVQEYIHAEDGERAAKSRLEKARLSFRFAPESQGDSYATSMEERAAELEQARARLKTAREALRATIPTPGA